MSSAAKTSTPTMVCQLIALLLVVGSASSKDIVIVGAGVSGIAAATRLLDAGFNVTVIDAEDRIGGRINSVLFGNGYVDLGAQFVHGEKGNIIYEMIEGLDLTQHTNINFNLYTSDGVTISEEMKNTLLTILMEINEEANGQNEGVVLDDFIRNRYAEVVMDIFKGDKSRLEDALATTETFTHALLSIQPSTQRVAAIQNITILPGDANLNWKANGFKIILGILLKDHPDLKPHLGIRATKIEWSGNDQKVVVHCSSSKVFTTDHVIFTGSLGVLKADHKNLFAPGLAQNKVNVIENMGFAVVMKGIMEFEERWWDGALPAMFIWKNRNSWITDLTWTIELPDNPKVLMYWITGKYVPIIEKLTDAEFTDQIVQALKTFFGAKYNVTKPIKTLRTKWWTNKNFRGAYSFETVESRNEPIPCHSILAEPLVKNGVPKVLFAGEATHPIYYASVHGAIETGYTVADSLINLH